MSSRTEEVAPTASVTHVSDRPLDLRSTLAPLRRGSGDPTFQVTADGTVWRTTRMPSGPATQRLRQVDRGTVVVDAWGPGAGEAVAAVPALLGEDDDASGFAPEHELLRDALRRHPGMRIPRTNRVMESVVPAVLEQKVTGVQAWGAWRWLLRRYGEDAPGPTPGPTPAATRLLVPPPAEVWRRVPSWDWHRAGVGPQRSQTVVRCARVADQLEGCATLSWRDAERRLRAVPGVGAWTAAEVAQRALGDPDALSVGDYHLAGTVGWALLGRVIDDDAMVELLEPLRPHRYRAVRLIELTPGARPPRRGPRITIQDHRAH